MSRSDKELSDDHVQVLQGLPDDLCAALLAQLPLMQALSLPQPALDLWLTAVHPQDIDLSQTPLAMPEIDALTYALRGMSDLQSLVVQLERSPEFTVMGLSLLVGAHIAGEVGSQAD